MAHQSLLTWTAPATGDAPTSYDVQRAPVVGGVVGTFASIASVAVPATTYTDLAVTAGSEYEYRVASVNAAGESAFDTDTTVVTIPLAIPAPPTGLTAVAS